MVTDAPSLLTLVGSSTSALAEQAGAEAGFRVTSVPSLADLLWRLRERAWSATLLSLAADGVDDRVAGRVAEEVRAGALILTAPAISLTRAVWAERAGAVALLREPPDVDELRKRLQGIIDEGRAISLPPLSPTDQAREDGQPVLLGESQAMAHVFETIARVARSSATVLLTGESGTGKEVVARALHWAGDRREGPFVAVNCAAIPEHLLESELFGHEKGAFTGAVARRVGRFERASGGTLFLDEIGDMSLVLQAKVLRALEERTVERVGGDRGVPVDVRVVAATNHDLADALADGRFREDLYYRLAVVELSLPPLRDRDGDVRTLALHFAAQFAMRHRRPVRAITAEALARLEAARWPGNVRELRNVMDRAVLLAEGTMIRTSHLRVGASAPSGAAHARPETGYTPTLSLEAVEADHIARVLDFVGGHIGRAAETLGIHRNTLTRKMKEHGLGS